MITIYSTPLCKYCSHAKNYMDAKKLEYQVHDVLSDKEKRAEMIEKSKGMSVPVVEVNGHVMVGWNQQEFEKHLAGA